jgi:hypothetical protein
VTGPSAIADAADEQGARACIARYAARWPDHFLSATNPIATREQLAIERDAIALLDTEAVRAAREQARHRWTVIAGPRLTDEARARFDELIAEYCYCYALKAANGDANHPRYVSGLYGPGHRWFGVDVPGSRGAGGDGPDQNYSFFPVDHGSRYRLTGCRIRPRPADTTYTVTGSLGFTMTLSDLDARDVDCAPDGSFAITIGPEPADGDPNHLQTAPDARYVFVRECRSDWRQVPAIHRIERLDPPRLPEPDFAARARRCARFIIDDACPMFWLAALAQTIAPNTMGAPQGSAGVGGLTTQCISFGRAVLDEDDALLIRVSGREAPFRDIVAHDFWFRTLDYWRITSSYNAAQTQVNADGSSTYVVARSDPGAANWIDTGGLSEVVLVHRWQGIAFDPRDATGPAISAERVTRADIVRGIAAGTIPAITAEDRERQRERRFKEFGLRYRE